jgi:hypothetical protein
MDDFDDDFGPSIDGLDYWRLCDELSVVQAALLIVGVDPSGRDEGIDNEGPARRPKGYNAAKAALVNAVNGKRLAATIVESVDRDGNSYGPDWHSTTIMVEDLRTWLRSRGINTGFFFPSPEAEPDYLSASHPNYSAKLAAAIEAWKAVSANAELRRGKSVKQALIVWLRQHANEFGADQRRRQPE